MPIPRTSAFTSQAMAQVLDTMDLEVAEVQQKPSVVLPAGAATTADGVVDSSSLGSGCPVSAVTTSADSRICTASVEPFVRSGFRAFRKHSGASSPSPVTPPAAAAVTTVSTVSLAAVAQGGFRNFKRKKSNLNPPSSSQETQTNLSAAIVPASSTVSGLVPEAGAAPEPSPGTSTLTMGGFRNFARKASRLTPTVMATADQKKESS